MADTKKQRQTAPRASAAARTQQSKAAAAFQRFKAAGAAAAAATEGSATSSAAPVGATPSPVAMPPWPTPPSFSLSQPPQGWGMLPQPSVVQSAPLAVGPLSDRLGSTLRLGIDVINMALAGSLRLLGGIGSGGHEHCCGGVHGYGGHACAEQCGGYDCCCAFEHDHCCTPSVGNCCH